MPTALDLTGSKFGKLTVISFHETIKKSNRHFIRYWNCICECGNNKIISQESLRGGSSKSCGCSRIELTSKRLFKGVGQLGSSYWSRVLRGVRDRNLEITITIEDAWNQFLKQNGKCALTGLDITLNPIAKERNLATASLDRIDSTKGYELDNIQWIHKDLQFMKNNYNQDYFIEMCRLVANKS